MLFKMQKRTDNKSISAKQVTYKSIAQKSIVADCGAKKSVFAKEYKPDKKIVFTNYKTCICIVKTVNNTQVTRFQKKFVLISKNRIKGKSKGVIFLTESIFFIHEIEDKYGLESELETYLQFFTY